jgi:phosphoribosyl-dephospho-CoA transferase
LADVAGTRSFPSLEAVSSLLPPFAREPALRLRTCLADLGVGAEVYGGYGWERLTGLAYRRPGSDLDLLLRVSTLRQADAAAAALHASGIESPRLDGELVFPNGSAVAWREWAIWRAGWVDRVLVKRLDGPALVRAEHWSAWHDAQDEGAFRSEVSA